MDFTWIVHVNMDLTWIISTWIVHVNMDLTWIMITWIVHVNMDYYMDYMEAQDTDNESKSNQSS